MVARRNAVRPLPVGVGPRNLRTLVFPVLLRPGHDRAFPASRSYLGRGTTSGGRTASPSAKRLAEVLHIDDLVAGGCSACRADVDAPGSNRSCSLRRRASPELC